jgi:hypothetical protein
MCEKFAMKNVASKTDRASFTVWVTVGFPVGMVTQCAAAREATDYRLQATGTKKRSAAGGRARPVACHL